MIDQQPLTIEILGLGNGTEPVVLDRVIGGTIYLDEAKRIGHRLFEKTAEETTPRGFRVLSRQHHVVYEWHAGDDEAAPNHTG
jgi:hypothetical protein